MQHFMRFSLRLMASLVALMLLAGAACAQKAPPSPEIDIATAPAVLVMIGDPGCPYCARFEREVAPGYMASEDGKLVPLVRRDRRAPDIAFIERVVFSPTFVMLVRGREVGRIVGYAGADMFWMQLAALMEDARMALKRSGAAIPNFAARDSERR
ncbi:MAG: thioredoxin family protein [Hyphomicrobiaceae bacterium]